MAQVVYTARALASLEHVAQFLSGENPEAAEHAVDAIQTALEHLSAHPLVGRRVSGDVRELIISFGATGYIALYRFVVQNDEVRVLALRSQREIGYLP